MTDVAYDHDETGDYQSLSHLAAVALVLGILSPAVLVHPLLMIVPAAAAGAALLALGKIQSSAGALTGASLARWGLALAILFAVAAAVRGPVRTALISRQTAAVAEAWLTALAEGRLDDAFRLIGGQGMQSLGPPREDPDATAPAVEELMTIARATMQSDPLFKQLAGMKLPLTVTIDPNEPSQLADEGGRVSAAASYLLAGADGGGARRVQLRFTRLPAYEEVGLPWRVDSWHLQDDAAAGGPTR